MNFSNTVLAVNTYFSDGFMQVMQFSFKGFVCLSLPIKQFYVDINE